MIMACGCGAKKEPKSKSTAKPAKKK